MLLECFVLGFDCGGCFGVSCCSFAVLWLVAFVFVAVGKVV